MTSQIVRHASVLVGEASAHHQRFQQAALLALLAASDRDRKPLVVALAGMAETPRDSLARRLIDLAPARERALLREQIL